MSVATKTMDDIVEENYIITVDAVEVTYAALSSTVDLRFHTHNEFEKAAGVTCKEGKKAACHARI